MSYINPLVLGDGLLVVTNGGNKLHWCSAEPTTYATAVSLSLVNKAGPTVSSPANRSATGRKVTVSAITDGVCTASGTVTHWALVDTVNSRLLATNTIIPPMPVVSGDTVRSSAFDIGMPAPDGTFLAISGTPVLTAGKDVPYDGFTVPATGGTAPYAFSVASGSLPAGITLNSSTGVVSGTATTLGTSSGIIIRVTDNVGATADLASFSIVVAVATGTLNPSDKVPPSHSRMAI
jgi:hypothetical protein